MRNEHIYQRDCRGVAFRIQATLGGPVNESGLQHSQTPLRRLAADLAVTAPDATIISLAALAGRSNTSEALASAARCQCGPSGWQSLKQPRWRYGAAGILARRVP